MDFSRSDRQWHALSNDQQLCVADAALRHAVHTVAGQADTLAEEMEGGCLMDRGGPDALRLLASALRVSLQDAAVHPKIASLATIGVAGHA